MNAFIRLIRGVALATLPRKKHSRNAGTGDACKRFTELCDQYWAAWGEWTKKDWDLNLQQKASECLNAVRQFYRLPENERCRSRLRKIAQAKKIPSMSKTGIRRPR